MNQKSQPCDTVSDTNEILRPDFPGGSMVENPPTNAGGIGDVGLISESGRLPGGGNGNPFQHSCLENSMDRRAWQTTDHGVTESDMTEHKHKWRLLVAQTCLTLCNPMDCSPPGSSVHGILQARILGWVAIPLSRGTSQTRDRTLVSFIVGRFFTIWAERVGHDWAQAQISYTLMQHWLFKKYTL